MRRKISIILISTMVMSTLLAGCSNPIDKFKKDEVEIPTEVVEENTDVTLTGIGAYMVGDIVTIDDVISIDESAAGNVTNKVFLSDTGSLMEQLDTSKAGEFTVNIVVEFIDAGGWQEQYTYIVERPKSNLPDNVKANFDNAVNIYTYGSLSVVNKEGWEYTESNQSSSDTGMEQGVYYVNTSGSEGIQIITINEYSSVSEAVSAFKSGMVDTLTLFCMANENPEVMTDIFSGDIDVNSEEYTVWRDYASSISVTTEKIEIDGSVLYGVDGTTYSSDVMALYVDMSFVEDGYDHVLCGYMQYFNVGSEVYAVTYSNQKEIVLDEDDTDLVLTWITDTISMDSVSSVDILSDVVIVGTYEKDDTTSEVASNEVEVEESAEEESVSGMVGNVTSTYQSKHPEIYTWPEDSTKYRRWNYVIGEGVTYTGSIILPDGTVLSTEDGDSIDSSSGTAASGTNEQVSSSVTVSLISSYGTYFVSNQNKEDVVIDTASSSSSVAVVSYKSNKYYIETARAATITNYQQNCIYSTTVMKDGSFEVESVDSKTTTTELGKIVPYTISYTDYNNTKQEKGYMVIYNINNDYLIIYADNMDTDTSTMTELLSTLISK